VPLAPVRAALPAWAAPELAAAVVGSLIDQGRLEAADGGVRRSGHRPRLDADQEEASRALEEAIVGPGLAAPAIAELPATLRERPDVWSLVRRLESTGAIRQVADGLYLGAEELERAADRIRTTLGGKEGLGPTDFRDALPVTRKRLLPLLHYFDGRGTTVRTEEGRDVPPQD
jgi:hypothetical protein